MRICFMPYKASLWDCMHTVWQAAINDPECEVKVIPIPYSEIVEGVPVAVHDESDQFPAEVMVESHETFDVHSFGPDIIYLHNVFDIFNVVTRIPQRFFASTLKNTGASIVYLPYYLSGGALTESHGSLPSYDNVDWIITQTPQMAHHFSPRYRDKLLPWGSAKTDLVVRATSTNSTVPLQTPDWVSHLRGRTAVFLNTGIATVLAAGSAYFTRLKQVIAAVEQRRDIVLIWRPHPLLEATLTSQAPLVRVAYNALRKTATSSQAVLIDTTTDLSAALHWCSAYLGEPTSSAAHYFGAAGKPVLLLAAPDPQAHQQPPSSTCYDQAWMTDLVQDPDEPTTAWFAHARLDTLCRLDLATGEFTPVASLGQPRQLLRAHNAVSWSREHDELLVTPYFSRVMCRYQPSSGWMQRNEVPGATPQSFVRSVRWRDTLVLVPGLHPGLVLVDLSTGAQQVWDDWLEDNPAPHGNELIFHAMNGVQLEGDLLYMASTRTNALFIFDLATHTVTRHEVGQPGEAFWDLLVLDRTVWLAPAQGSTILAYDLDTGQTRRFSDYPAGFTPGVIPFVNVVAWQGQVLALPRDANAAVRIDPHASTPRIELADVGPLPYQDAAQRSTPEHDWVSNALFATCLADGTVVTQWAYDLSLSIGSPDGSWRLVSTRCADPDAWQRTQEHGCFGSYSANLPWACQQDGGEVSLDDLLDHLTNGQHDEAGQRQAFAAVMGPLDGRVGQRIHDGLVRTVREQNSLACTPTRSQS